MTQLPVAMVWTVVLLLIVYFVIVSWIGKVGARYSRTMRGFATAKGKVNPWLVGMSFAASYASANLFIGVPGLAYTYGTPVLWYTLGCFGMSWIGLVLFAKRFWSFSEKKGGVSTLPEWLGQRYNSKTLQVLVSLLILFNIYYIVGQNVGLATIFETVIGVPYFWGLVFGVVLTVLYIGLGGAFAQMITDAIQGLLMSVISLLVFVSLLWMIGGGWGVFEKLEAGLHAVDPNLTTALSQDGLYNSTFAIVSIQFLLFSFVLMPHLLNKVLTLESEKQLRPFVLSSGLTLFGLSVFAVIGGLAARVLLPNLENADQALPAYLLEAFPPIIVVIMFMGLVSAILSSTDSLYLGITSSIGNDLYKVLATRFKWLGKGMNKDALDTRSVKVAKGALLIIGFLTFYLSINRPQSLAILIQFSFSAILSGIVAPLILGYTWRKANRNGAIASLIVGSICYILFTGFNIIPNMFIAMFYSAALGFLTMIIGCLLFPINRPRTPSTTMDI